MIYIAIIDHRLSFKIKPFRARKVMPNVYHRFFLTDLSEFLPSQGLRFKFLQISVPVSEITFLTYLIKLLETKSFQSLEGSDREKRQMFKFVYKI